VLVVSFHLVSVILLHLVLVILLHLVLVGLPYRRVPSYLGAAPEPFGVLNKQFPDGKKSFTSNL
jgi:hypothetical protein